MKKAKLELTDLKVQSYSTRLDEGAMNQVRGGYFLIRGGFYTYRTRWTSVDIRSDETESEHGNPPVTKRV